MSGKENPDLFSHLSSNDGSLPLDFEKNTGLADLSGGETGKKTETSEPDSVKSQDRVEKNEPQRRPTHHAPPPYKKTVQETVSLEPKNNVETKGGVVVVQDKPMEKPETEAVMEKEEVKPATVAVEAVQTPVSDSIAAPAEIEVAVPAAAAPAPAIVSAPVSSVVPASVSTVQAPIISPTAAQVEKSPEKVQAPKRGRQPKAPQHAEKTEAIVKQVAAPAVSVSHERKVLPEQKISKEESEPAKKTNAMGKFSADNATAGQLLQEGRVRAGLSIDQVSISTKIKKTFIECLERDDFENLPASVYVNAYTRSLCSLYDIDNKLVFSLLNKVKGKKFDYTVPEEVIQQLEKGKQVNTVQENKVKRMLLMGFAACFTVAACISITYYVMHAGGGSPSSSATAVKAVINPELPVQAGTASGISAKTLEEDMEKKLMAPHVFTMTSLPLAER